MEVRNLRELKHIILELLLGKTEVKQIASREKQMTDV